MPGSLECRKGTGVPTTKFFPNLPYQDNFGQFPFDIPQVCLLFNYLEGENAINRAELNLTTAYCWGKQNADCLLIQSQVACLDGDLALFIRKWRRRVKKTSKKLCLMTMLLVIVTFYAVQSALGFYN